VLFFKCRHPAIFCQQLHLAGGEKKLQLAGESGPLGTKAFLFEKGKDNA
jgi:hypothetical protein